VVDVDRRNCWEVLHGKSEQAVEQARQGCARAAARVEQLEAQMTRLQALQADPQKLNVHGGAIALGHPLGASGAKLMATLIHALHQRGGRYGLQTMSEGGGMANVTIVERL